MDTIKNYVEEIWIDRFVESHVQEIESIEDYLLNEKFKFPIMNTIVLDCVSKPFDDMNKKMIYELLSYYSTLNENFNFLVTTDTITDSDERFELNGLNPLFKNNT